MITLYTTHCPKCNVLQQKLNNKNIEFKICDDIDYMLYLNIQQAPYLKVDDKLMDFSEAIKWVNEIDD